jgi:hypothetical protein
MITTYLYDGHFVASHATAALGEARPHNRQGKAVVAKKGNFIASGVNQTHDTACRWLAAQRDPI